MPAGFVARPLDDATWVDLETLVDRPGGSIVSGCWCMYYRRSGPVSISAAAAPANKAQLRDLVDRGTTPGLLGYLGEVPVGWISLGPHRLLAAAIDFARDNGVRLLEAYPVDKPVRSHDDFMFFGSRSLYERAGFHEVVRRSPTRVVMRRGLRRREPRTR